jgi:hypothetical protein
MCARLLVSNVSVIQQAAHNESNPHVMVDSVLLQYDRLQTAGTSGAGRMLIIVQGNMRWHLKRREHVTHVVCAQEHSGC